MQQPVSPAGRRVGSLGIGTWLANVLHREFVLEQRSTGVRYGEYRARLTECQEFFAHLAWNVDHICRKIRLTWSKLLRNCNFCNKLRALKANNSPISPALIPGYPSVATTSLTSIPSPRDHT